MVFSEAIFATHENGRGVQSSSFAICRSEPCLHFEMTCFIIGFFEDVVRLPHFVGRALSNDAAQFERRPGRIERESVINNPTGGNFYSPWVRSPLGACGTIS
jgi:hypothetical protein